MRPVYFFTWVGGMRGMGHLRRSIVIAESVRRRNPEIFFVVDVDGPPALVDFVRDGGFSTADKGVMLGAKDGIVVADRKDDISKDLETLRDRGFRVCLIDNMTPARFLSDVVIFPLAHFVDNLDWEGFGGVKLVGAEYFPLSRDFAKARDIHKDRDSILVTMGGTDFNNITDKVLTALEGGADAAVDVVIGPGFENMEALLKKWGKKGKGLRFHRNVSNLAPLMNEAAVAITAFGITLYELAYMGVPALIINNYPEDKEDGEKFRSFGTAIPLGYHADVRPEDIRREVLSLMADRERPERMSAKGRELVDGMGSERIAEAVLGAADK